MMPLGEAATALNASGIGADVIFTGVSSDSRTVAPGELFVALRGERFDGHAFLGAAQERGAIAAMVDQQPGVRNQRLESVTLPLLAVPDTRRGLGQLAAYWRRKFTIPLVALTGSNGKTIVKEMLASILRQHCGPAQPAILATEGNLNNALGVPLTLLKLRAQHRYAVIAMGMNHPGEIAYLAGLAAPNVALVNNAGSAHVGLLGSVEAVARAKGEIFQGLGPRGTAVINADDPFADLWRKLAGSRRIVDFGLERKAAVSAGYQLEGFGSRLILRLPQGETLVLLQVPGQHNVRNALAAAAAAVALDVAPAAIAAGLAAFKGVKGRLQRKQCLHGAILIDDTYNANPDSVRAALAVLATAQDEKILVLGDMGELGEGAAKFHADIGAAARQAGVNAMLALGELTIQAVAAFGPEARHFERIEDLLAALGKRLAPGITVLVKGSRFMQMERVVNSFEVTDKQAN